MTSTRKKHEKISKTRQLMKNTIAHFSEMIKFFSTEESFSKILQHVSPKVFGLSNFRILPLIICKSYFLDRTYLYGPYKKG